MGSPIERKLGVGHISMQVEKNAAETVLRVEAFVIGRGEPGSDDLEPLELVSSYGPQGGEATAGWWCRSKLVVPTADLPVDVELKLSPAPVSFDVILPVRIGLRAAFTWAVS